MYRPDDDFCHWRRQFHRHCQCPDNPKSPHYQSEDDDQDDGQVKPWWFPAFILPALNDQSSGSWG